MSSRSSSSSSSSGSTRSRSSSHARQRTTSTSSVSDGSLVDSKLPQTSRCISSSLSNVNKSTTNLKQQPVETPDQAKPAFQEVILTPKKNNFFRNCDIVLRRNSFSPKKCKKHGKESKISKSGRSRSLTKHKKRDKSKKIHKSPKKSHKSIKKKKKSEHHRDESESCSNYKKHVDIVRHVHSQSLPCSPIKTGNKLLDPKVTNTPLRFKNKSKLLDSTIRRNMRLSIENPSKKLKSKSDSDSKLILEITKQELELFESLIKKELDANGGATILITYQSDLDTKLHIPGTSHKELLNKFAAYFLSQVYSETKGEDEDTSFKNDTEDDLNETSSHKENDEFTQFATILTNKLKPAANYVLGVVRGSCEGMPDLIDYFADKYPQMIVKSSLLLNGKEINTECFSDYRNNVNATYLNGTYRYGPLLQTSLVGVRNEEIGDYFPEFIGDHLESNDFLKLVMPWGHFSQNENMNPMNSDDGPIIWARPGEQMIPTSNTKDQQLLNSNLNNMNGADRKKK